jgi:hypothetical protein
MKTFRNLILGVLAIAALISYQPAAQSAASVGVDYLILCRPPAPGVAGPSRVTNPGTSGGSYVLNAQGCAPISLANSDAAYFQSQGFTPGPNLFSLIQQTMLANTTATTSTITLPANAFIVGIILQETAGNAVTGGVNIGNATSATAYASAVTLGANALVSVADSALTRVYPATTPTSAQKILVAAQTSFNSASVNITILYSYF